jgi:hypothetical protein
MSMDAVFRALADPVRRQLLDSLHATQRRGRVKLHFLNPVPIQEIADRWIGKYERTRLRALSDLKRNLEGKRDGK